jgi:hypothetical protein
MCYSGILQVDVRSIDMKRHQLQLGNVPAKLWRLNCGLIAPGLLAFAVACDAHSNANAYPHADAHADVNCFSSRPEARD